MKQIFRTTIFILFGLYSATYAQTEITITEECVYLDELTAPSVPHSKVTCGFMPGETKNFPKEIIENYLRRAGINARVLNDVVVKREGEKLSSEEIIKAAEEAYKKAYPDITINIEQVRFSHDMFAEKQENFSIKIDTSKFGTTYAEVHNGFKKTQVYMYVRAYRKGYVATERIKPGESLAGKVRPEMVEITMSRQSILLNPDGLVAAKIIAKGKTITADQVREMPALSKGETVRLIYDNGLIKIETVGIAEENAFIGKPVQVRNTTSQKIITAYYIGGGVAKAML